MSIFSSKIKKSLDGMVDSLQARPSYQKLVERWDSLSQESKLYVQFAGAGCLILLFLVTTIASIWHVRGLKQQLDQKQELLNSLRSAREEISTLQLKNHKDLQAIHAAAEKIPWKTYFESVAVQVGIEPASLKVAPSSVEVEQDASLKALAKETTFDITVQKINVRQFTKFAFELENGSKPIKLRNLSIKTHPDLSGYLDAFFSVSGFILLESQ
jgi:hypothetical protein